MSSPVRLRVRAFTAIALSLAAVGPLPVLPTPIATAEPAREGLEAESRYSADFSSSSTKGPGLRFSKAGTPYFVEAYAKDMPKRAADRSGNKYSYTAGAAATITYTDLGTSVKEDITLTQRPPFSSVSFSMDWHADLSLAQVDRDHVWRDPNGAEVFRLTRPTIVDAAGRGGDISLTIDGTNKTGTLSADPLYLDTAVYPVLIDPSFTADGLLVPGRSVAVAGEEALEIYTSGASTCTNPVDACVRGLGLSGEAWSQTSLAALSDVKPLDVVMHSDAKAFVVGTDSLHNLKVWRLTRSGATWSQNNVSAVAAGITGTDVAIAVTPNGSTPRVWVSYRSATAKIVSFADDGAGTWTAATLSNEATNAGTALVPNGSSVWAFYRDGTIPNSTISRRSWDGSALGAAATVTTGDIAAFRVARSVTGSSQRMLMAFPRYVSSAGTHRMETCIDDGAANFTCGDVLNTFVQDGTSRFSVSGDEGRFTVAYVTNSATKYKVLYDGAWSSERSLASTTVAQLSVSDGTAFNAQLAMLADNDGLHQLTVDLPPVVSAEDASRDVISQVTACQATTYSTASFREKASPAPSWSVTVRNVTDPLPSPDPVKVLTGSGASLNQAWDGKDVNGNLPPSGQTDKTYRASIAVTDAGSFTVNRSVDVTVDVTAPALASGSSFSASPDYISPNTPTGDGSQDAAVFSGSLSEPGVPTIIIKNAGGTTVRTLTGASTSDLASLSWNGRVGPDADDDPVADGVYTATLSVTDAGCNAASNLASKIINVDILPPTTTITSTNPAQGSTTNNNDPSFTFTSSEPTGATFGCSLDNPAEYTSCTSPKTYTDVADGLRTFYVRSKDRAGNTGLPATRLWTIDTVIPAAPTNLVTVPTSPSNQTGVPKVKGNVTTDASSVQIFSNAACTTSASASGDAATFTSTGLTVTPALAANTTATFYAKATDAGGNPSACSSTSVSYSYDTAAPDTTITSGPSGTVSADDATFTFSSTEPSGASFSCSLDGGSYGSCGTPYELTSLADASYTLSVKAIDAAGNTDTTAASRTWTVDTTGPPAPTITSPGQGALLAASSVTVSGTAPASTTVRLREGGALLGTTTSDSLGAWSKSVSLGDGPHTLFAHAVDSLDNEGAAAVGRSFTVDTAPPGAPTFIRSEPSSPSNSNALTVFGAVPAPDALTAKVKLYTDGSCLTLVGPALGTDADDFTSTGVGLSVGSNSTTTFYAKAQDLAGNLSTCANLFTYVEDSLAPDTTITGGPSGVVGTIGSPAVTFTSSESNSTFLCTLDGLAETVCTSPWASTGLSDGSHTLAVKAKDQAGNVDDTAATRTWTTDALPPVISLSAVPALYPNGDNWRDTTTIPGTASDARSTFTWTLKVPDTAAGRTYTGSSGTVVQVWDGTDANNGLLADGTYTAKLTAVDAVGNVSAPVYATVELSRFSQVLGSRSAWELIGPGRIRGGHSIQLNAFSHNLVVSKQDAKVDAPGPDVVFRRTYNSQNLASGNLGRGWRHSFEETVVQNADLSVSYTDGGGDVHHYIRNGDGTYAHPPGLFDTLTKSLLDQTFTLSRQPGYSRRFRADGRLAETADPNGNRQVLNYDANGRLATVTNGVSITYLSFGWSGGMLSSVTDQASRSTSYGYAAGNLLTIAAPLSGDTTVFGSTVDGRILSLISPRGDAWTVGYSTDGATTITAPTSVGGVWSTTATGVLARTFSRPGSLQAATFGASGAIASLGYMSGSQSWTRDWNLLVTESKDRAGATSSSTAYPYAPPIITFPVNGSTLNCTSVPIQGVTSGVAIAVFEPPSQSPILGPAATNGLFSGGAGFTNGTHTIYARSLVGVLDSRATSADSTSVTFTVNGNGSNSCTAAPITVTPTPQTVTPASTTSVSYTYDSMGRVLTRTDQLNKTMTNVYDASGNLTSTTDPLSDKRTYTYDLKGNRLTEVSPRGNAVGETPALWASDYTYDLAGNRLSVLDPLDRKTTFTYDANGRVLKTVSPRGNVAGGTPSDYETEYQYNSAGEKVTSLDPLDNKTTFTYDAAGLMLTKVSPLGYTSGQTPTGHTTHYTYDIVGNRLSQTDQIGNERSWTYDANGNALTEVTPRGNAAGPASAYRTTHTYDALGHKLTKLDPLGALTKYRYGYGGAGALFEEVNPVGYSTYYWQDWRGRETRVDRPSAGATTFGYDAVGRTTTETSARGNAVGGNPAHFTTTTAYDAAGRTTTVTDHLGHTTKNEYDQNGNQTKLIDPRGVGSLASSYSTAMVYDKADQLTSKTVPPRAAVTYLYDQDGHRTDTTLATGGVTKQFFDRAGRLVEHTDADDGRTTYGYDADGNRTSVVEPRGNEAGAIATDYDTLYRFDASGQQTEMSMPLGGRTTYAFDEDGNRTSVTEPRGNLPGTDPADYRTHSTYDALGRLTSIADPTGRSVGYTYDAFRGRAASMQDGFGTTTYSYDAADRRTSSDAPDTLPASPLGSTDPNVVTATYDVEGNVKTLAGTPGTATYTYDRRNDPLSGDGPAEDWAYTSYDEARNLKDVVVPSGGFSYSWRADDGLATRTGPAATSLAYNSAGRLTSLTHASGGVDETDLSAAGRITGLRYRVGLGVSPYLSSSVTRDAAGRPTAVTDVPSSGVRYAFNFDRDGRVVAQTFPTTLGVSNWTLGYDAAGNRMSRTDGSGLVTSYTTDAAGRLTRTCTTGTTPPVSVAEFTHDAAGNRTAATTSSRTSCASETATITGQTTYQWGSGARLLQVTAVQGGQTTSTTLSYDAIGRLTSESSGTQETRYRYDGDRLEAMLDSLGQVVAAFSYDQRGVPFSMWVPSPTGPRSLYYHFDALGSVDRLTDAAGVLALTYRYDPYGRPSTEHGPAWLPHAALNPYAFMARTHRLLPSSGLLYSLNSYFDPATGTGLRQEAGLTPVSLPTLGAAAFGAGTVGDPTPGGSPDKICRPGGIGDLVTPNAAFGSGPTDSPPPSEDAVRCPGGRVWVDPHVSFRVDQGTEPETGNVHTGTDLNVKGTLGIKWNEVAFHTDYTFDINVILRADNPADNGPGLCPPKQLILPYMNVGDDWTEPFECDAQGNENLGFSVKWYAKLIACRARDVTWRSRCEDVGRSAGDDRESAAKRLIKA